MYKERHIIYIRCKPGRRRLHSAHPKLCVSVKLPNSTEGSSAPKKKIFGPLSVWCMWVRAKESPRGGSFAPKTIYIRGWSSSSLKVSGGQKGCTRRVDAKMDSGAVRGFGGGSRDLPVNPSLVAPCKKKRNEIKYIWVFMSRPSALVGNGPLRQIRTSSPPNDET